MPIDRVPFSPLSLTEGFAIGFHVLIQLVQIDICQNRADDPALRCAGIGLVKCPLFHISGVQKFPYQPQKPFIRNSLPQYTDQNIMVDTIKKAVNVAFNEPLCSRKGFLYAHKRRVTASLRAEAMRGRLKAAFVYGLQYHTDYFLQKLIIKRRYSQRTLFPVLLGDICPAGGLRPIAFIL